MVGVRDHPGRQPCQNAVAAALSTWGNWNNLRQYLREWLYDGSGFRMEIYGREGTLVATGSVSSQRGEMLRVQGARGSHELQDLEIPDRFVYVPSDFPRGDPFNIGQMYALFAEAVRTGQNRAPTFDDAVDLHRFIDTIKQASDTGRELPVA